MASLMQFFDLCAKYTLYILNLVKILTGIILLIVGVVTQASFDEYTPLLDQSFFSVPMLLIAIGAIIFVVSFCGCWGACRQNYLLIRTFYVVMSLIFVLELIGGIAGYLLRDKVTHVLESELRNSMYYYENSTQVKSMWDKMQINLRCCGDNSSTTWLDIYPSLPPSCCGYVNTSQECIIDNSFKSECMKVLGDFLRNKAGVLGGTALGILCIQLLEILLACRLSSKIKGYESV